MAVGMAALLLALAAAPVEAHWHAGFWVGLGTGALLTAPLWWAPYGYPYAAPYPHGYPYASPYPYPYAAYPYAYPYGYPYYEPPPAQAVPPPAGVAPPAAPHPTPTTPTPSPLTPSPPSGAAPAPPAAGEGGIARQCETVWVDGHYETHSRPGGQITTVWVPAASRQICREAGRP
jgi:hypothetical protein